MLGARWRRLTKICTGTPKAYITIAFGIILLTLALTFNLLQSSLVDGHSRAIKSEETGYKPEEKIDPLERQKVLSELGMLDKFRKGERTDKSIVQSNSFMQTLVYNRVGKCGSRSMLSLISKLAVVNNFTFYGSPVSNRSRVSLPEMIQIAKKINSLPRPSLYSRHIHYLDLAKFGMNPPVYINMIRDPIERFSSQYHFLRYGDNNKAGERAAVPWRKEEKEMDINDCVLNGHPSCSVDKLFYITPYFCGQDIACQRPSKESLYRAKVHVMENYLVIGYLEDFVGMLQVLEKVLPKYFKNAVSLWKTLSENSLSHTSTLKKIAINETTKAVLRERMKEEYEFYNFVKVRFRVQKKQMGIYDP